MTVKQAKKQLNDLLEYCAESGEEWEDDKEALEIAIRYLDRIEEDSLYDNIYKTLRPYVSEMDLKDLMPLIILLDHNESLLFEMNNKKYRMSVEEVEQ